MQPIGAASSTSRAVDALSITRPGGATDPSAGPPHLLTDGGVTKSARTDRQRWCQRSGWRTLALGGKQTLHFLRGSQSRPDRSLGVQGAEVVAGEENATAATSHCGLQLAAAREAVRRPGGPALNPRLHDLLREVRQDFIEVSEILVADLIIVEFEQLARQGRGGEGHDAATGLPLLLIAADNVRHVQQHVE